LYLAISRFFYKNNIFTILKEFTNKNKELENEVKILLNQKETLEREIKVSNIKDFVSILTINNIIF